jgi:hypothetical protein
MGQNMSFLSKFFFFKISNFYCIFTKSDFFSEISTYLTKFDEKHLNLIGFNQKLRKYWILPEKSLVKKTHILAHSGRRNLTKIIFWQIPSQYGSKFCIKCVKSLLKRINFVGKRSTMGQCLKKDNGFFKYIFFNIQSRNILKYELWNFRLKSPPWKRTNMLMISRENLNLSRTSHFKQFFSLYLLFFS